MYILVKHTRYNNSVYKIDAQKNMLRWHTYNKEQIWTLIISDYKKFLMLINCISFPEKKSMVLTYLIW